MIRIANALLIAVLTFGGPALGQEPRPPSKSASKAIKVSLKQYGSKVVTRVQVSALAHRMAQFKKMRAKINVYAGKSEDETKKIKSYTWNPRKRVQKWELNAKALCKKGYRHVRIKVKLKSKGGENDLIKRTLDLDC